MLNWRLSHNDQDTFSWDSELSKFEGHSFLQFYGWGEHKRNFGWDVERWVAENADKNIESMAQVFLKRKPLGIVLAWVTGGPVGDIESWSQGLREAIKKQAGCKSLYLRVLNCKESSDEEAKALISAGWSKPGHRLRSGLSMALSLAADLDEMKGHLSKSWKKNLSKGYKKDLQITEWANPDLEQIHALYVSMQDLKGLKEQFSLAELKSIFNSAKDKIVICKCCDSSGNLLAIRGYFYFNDYAWDLFAAASPEARKVSASHVLFWELLSHCKKNGVLEYDLMGIDPESNPGVYQFKKGTGARHIKYLGEWEWCSNPLFKKIINLYLKIK